MWRYSREGAAGYDAVSVFGVGTLVRYNHIHEGQYNAIRYQVIIMNRFQIKMIEKYFKNISNQCLLLRLFSGCICKCLIYSKTAMAQTHFNL